MEEAFAVIGAAAGAGMGGDAAIIPRAELFPNTLWGVPTRKGQRPELRFLCADQEMIMGSTAGAVYEDIKSGIKYVVCCGGDAPQNTLAGSKHKDLDAADTVRWHVHWVGRGTKCHAGCTAPNAVSKLRMPFNVRPLNDVAACTNACLPGTPFCSTHESLMTEQPFRIMQS